MAIKVRIYTKNDTRLINLNDGEVEDMLTRYLSDEYIRDGEEIESVTLESITV